MLHGLGIKVGVDLDKVVNAGAFINNILGRPSNSKVATAVSRKSGEIPKNYHLYI